MCIEIPIKFPCQILIVLKGAPMKFGIWIYPYHGWWCYVADFMWLILVLKLLLKNLSLLSKHWRELGVLRGTLIYISAFGNMLCWLSVILSGILIGVRDYLQRICWPWVHGGCGLDGVCKLFCRLYPLQYLPRSNPVPIITTEE